MGSAYKVCLFYPLECPINSLPALTDRARFAKNTLRSPLRSFHPLRKMDSYGGIPPNVATYSIRKIIRPSGHMYFKNGIRDVGFAGVKGWFLRIVETATGNVFCDQLVLR